jgi:hypothetical protein
LNQFKEPAVFNFLRRKPAETVQVSPIERVTAAIDELNLAMKELRKEDEYRHLRPWVRPGDARTRSPARVMLGYWDSDTARFVTVYGED